MLLRAGLVGVVAQLVVLGIACLAMPPAPTPEAPFSLEDHPPPVAGGAGPPGQPEQIRVIGADSGRVNLRARPGLTGA
jgi:hypothetical protein